MNSKMKTLSLAVLGLVGFAAAGSAMAAGCPAITPASPAPWSAVNVGGGASAGSSIAPGYDGTSCKWSSMLGNSGNARAQVRDDTPANETRYRAQFILDANALIGTNGNNQANIFLANAANLFNGILPTLRLQFTGSGPGTKRVNVLAACNNGTTNICIGQFNLPVQAGANRIEIDLQFGANGVGTLRYWASDLATATTDGVPLGTIPLTGGNAGWVGVDSVFLGLGSPSSAYRTLNTGKVAYFDQFDSRRQTFIGKP